MRRAPTVAEFEAGLGLAWTFDLTTLERQHLCTLADFPHHALVPWDGLDPGIRLALARAALSLCEIAAKVAPDLER